MQIFDSYIEAGQELSAKDKREYYTALIEFLYYGVEPKLKGAANAVFVAIRPSLMLSKQRSDNGKKGAAKTNLAAKQNGDLPSGKMKNTPSSNSKSNSKEDIPNGISKKNSTFSPPTIDEVRSYAIAYATEKGVTPIDAERFCDFYASKGWMVGKNKMKDWRASVRSWSRNSEPKEGVNIDDFAEYL